MAKSVGCWNCAESLDATEDDAAETASSVSPDFDNSINGMPGSQFDLTLFVRSTSAEGVVRVARSRLTAIQDVDNLHGLFRHLICGGFPNGLPDYLVSDEYYKFVPSDDFVSLPGNAVNTHFRLVASVDGWEVTVAERDLNGDPDPWRRLLVTVAEFESEPVTLSDGTRAAVCLVAYPTVSVQRAFLHEALMQATAKIALQDSSACSSETVV